MPLWRRIHNNRLEKELKELFVEVPQLRKHWKHIQKTVKKAKPEKLKQLNIQTNWLPDLIDEFVSTLCGLPRMGNGIFL